MKISDIPEYIGIAAASYFGLLTLGSIIENVSQRIKSEEELKTIATEEAHKLNINTYNLVTNLYKKGTSEYDNLLGARCLIAGFNRLTEEFVSGSEINKNPDVRPIKLLDLKEGWGANRGAIKHELYHFKKHFPRRRGLLQKLKWFYQEPAAVFYALTGKETL